MNYKASVSILIIYFLWVLIATFLWSKRMNKIKQDNKLK